MIAVKTSIGETLLVNEAKIVLVGPVVADGAPVLGQSKMMLEGGVGLLLGMGVREVGELVGLFPPAPPVSRETVLGNMLTFPFVGKEE